MCDALKKLEVVRVYQLVFVHFFCILRSNKEKYAQKGTKQSHFCYFFSIVVWASMYAYNVQDSKVFNLCIFIGNKCVCVYNTYVIGSDVHMKNWYEIK